MTLNQALISETTLNTAAASVTIAVPSGYTDVRFVISARDASTAQYANDLQININGSSANISNTILYGNGAGVGTGNTTVWLSGVPGNSSTANTFSNVEVYISDYANASKPKAFTADGVTENNATNSMIILGSGLYNSNTPITSVTFNLYGGTNFTAGSSFTLYGISKLGVTPTATPKATGGDIIKNDGTYWYHAFLSTGAFIPQQALSCDVLVVAGGGGGGNYYSAGGGGAGGLLGFTNQSLTSASVYAVTVGAGGASPTGANGANGSNSQFGSLTTVLGGGGGGARPNNGIAGGSGGGGGGYSANTIGGAGTSGQGFAGADGKGLGFSPQDYAGGGGGAGGVGVSGIGVGYSNGGVGSSSYSSWGSATSTGDNRSGTYYYAGGGGGYCNNAYGPAVGGYGGGGSGNRAQGALATAGTVNTGGGGGGGWDVGSNDGKAGGSGIVVIRYAMA